MPSPVELYPLVMGWLRSMEVTAHPVALVALADVVTALLCAQSLRPSALMRAVLSPVGVPAAQRYKRVRRCWDREWLAPAWLTPRLVRAVLALVAPRPGVPVHVALDSVRCGPWEVFTLGVVWHGRVLLVGWAVLPYPWPKGRFTPTVCALLRQVAAVWPPAVGAHLVADRAFPSRALFQTLRAVGWGWTVRLPARSWVTVGGQRQWARALLAGARVGVWTLHAGLFGGGSQAIPGRLVIGRGLVVLPAHQRTAGSLRHRAAQFARRQRHLTGKHPGRAPDASPETDAWVILFTSHTTASAASGSYRLRWATEGRYRDAQGGWDGRHGWDLEPVLTRTRTATHVERLVGLWALGTLLQTYVGQQLAQQVAVGTAPAPVAAVVAQWTTTGRLSVWAHGQFALQDRSGHLRAWLVTTLTAGATRLAPPAATAPAASDPPPLESTTAPATPRWHGAPRSLLPAAA